jgi:very-short-patch-repair endonuclease
MPRNSNTVERAKRQRRELTVAEERMWAVLRDRRFREIKFRRQHAIGPYVVDFACVAARLVIELDGGSHDREEQVAFDVERTAFLERAGWRVLRLRNDDLITSRDGVYLAIEAALGISPGT